MSLIGTPIMANKMTMEKERIQYARVLVDVNVHKMPDVVYFQNERGIVVEQKVKYEWRPSKCTHCQGYGHEIQDCRKKALCFDGQGTNIASSSRPSEQEMEGQPGVITINLRTHDECRMLECERIEQLQ